MNTQTEITFRPITSDDEALLYRIYASTREDEMALVDWDEAQKAAFLIMQFTAQHRYYQEHYPDAAFEVILLNGQPAGRLYVDQWPEEVRIVDITLLPEYRNAGIGTTLLKGILEEAAQAGKRVSIHVERFNPAMRLYERLGFSTVGEHGVYYLMEWLPGNSTKSDKP
ncbi:MAG TPA: GNAT family N-acetyltransferase [Chloroflexia bacterium]|nr:GNAT family N-acetyltransferase [Chloroflexia bacterium]